LNSASVQNTGYCALFPSERIVSLARAKNLLDRVLSESETTVTSIGNEFQILAREVDALLSLAAAALESIDEGGIETIPSKVQCLVKASDQLIQKRFESTSTILDVVKDEQRLLERLSYLNAGNRSIARETRMLGLLTSIEAAHLGRAGAQFHHLAGELRSFADSVTYSSAELDGHARGRQQAIQESQHKLASALPRIRAEFDRLDATFEQALSDVRLSVSELAACPERFHGCVESVAGQIAGVVSAIQSHDITRQQAEHVRDGLEAISMVVHEDSSALNLPKIATRLTVQIFQLKNIQESMGAWASKIDACLVSILGVSSSELSGIGPLVLRQEKTLSSQLIRIKDLEQECGKDREEVQGALSGLSHLMKMIADHLRNSRLIRDRMQLLSFNSIIRSNNLGSEAAVMLEISKNISRVSGDWNEMTDRSEETMEEVLGLVGQAEEGMKGVSRGGDDGLDLAQDEIKCALRNLKAAAEGAAAGALQITDLTSSLYDKIESIRLGTHLLNGLVDTIGEALGQIEGVRYEIEAENPGIRAQLNDRVELENEYSARYTTEIERLILRAALFGDPVTAPQTVTEGNEVELF
jgi:methyl-accepting chemotaxis protein